MARKAKKKAFAGTSMGISSIIAILVIMVLVVFSALSVTTAKADLTLSQKTADSLQAYYDADCKAEELMAEAAAAIRGGSDDWQNELRGNGFEVTDAEAGNGEQSGGVIISYTVAIDENRNLAVVLRSSADGELTRQTWKVTPSSEWNAEKNLDLYIPK
jgi:hypothetical protein